MKAVLASRLDRAVMPSHNAADALLDSIRIPTLPASIQRISALLANQNVSMAELASALANDPPLTAKALKIANSVYYGLREKTTSAQMAISVLGLETLASIVVQASVLQLYAGTKDSEGFRVQDFWKHSILTAQICEVLAKKGRRREADLTPQGFYTCGLLHDLGRIMLYDTLGEEYVALIQKSKSLDGEIDLQETHVLGLNHADVGAVAAFMWRLPEPIPTVIKYHHRAGLRASDSHVVNVVACADEIANAVATDRTRDTKGVLALVKTRPAGLDPSALVEAIDGARASVGTIEV